MLLLPEQRKYVKVKRKSTKELTRGVLIELDAEYTKIVTPTGIYLCDEKYTQVPRISLTDEELKLAKYLKLQL